MGTQVYVEDMDFAALQHRAKETTVNEKTGRINRKKRFGKSLANRAPAMMIQTLDNKLKSLGKEGILKVDTHSYKASQFDHTNGEYHKKELSVRQFTLSNGDTVQRDLYSAWLLMNACDSLKEPDPVRCQETYGSFIALHNQEISRIKSMPHKLSSFGV